MTGLHISRLRCEYLTDPLGIDERAPRLSWMLASRRRGARQSRRVLVASTPEKLARGEGDRWDSGRVAGAVTAHLAYAGRRLRSRDVCHWRVEVWDERGAAAVSAPACWSMGLLTARAWRARWIAADPEILRRDPAAIAPTPTEPGTPAWFRREFAVPGAVRRATLYASARGLFELHLGGRRVGEDLFAPEWTDYDRRIQYRTYDVTGQIRAGRNVLGAVLGDGWWSGYVGWQETRGRYGSLENSLLVQLELELKSGRRLTVVTDGSWRCNAGPILSSDFMMGEVYDARRERAGWDRAGFNDGDWLPARVVDGPGGAAGRAALAARAGDADDHARVRRRSRPRAVHLRSGPELHGLGAAAPAGEGRHARDASPRRAPRRRGPALHGKSAPRPGHRRLCPQGRRAGGVGAPFHFSRLSVRRADRPAPPPVPPRRDRLCHPLVPAAGRPVRVLASRREPALAQRPLVPAGQFSQRADGLPAARRAAGLDGRRAGLPAHGQLQPRRGGVLHQMDDRRGGRADAGGRVPRHGAAAARGE